MYYKEQPEGGMTHFLMQRKGHMQTLWQDEVGYILRPE